MSMEKPFVYVVAGPTAVGKSDFAVQLALEQNGEVVSVDSRQVFIGFNLASGKITKEEMRGVKHHMIDVYDIKDETVSVALFQKDALTSIADILKRGKVPILCGGSGLYLDALLYEKNFPEVKQNKELRKELSEKSVEELAKLLQEKDVHRHKSIDTKNKVRLIRALEIVDQLGTVPEEKERGVRFDTVIYVLDAEKEVLREKIQKRIEKRITAGMLDEIQSARIVGVSDERLLSLGLEYNYCTQYLRGDISLSDCKAILFQKTWLYAKRQITWNTKHLQNVVVIPIKD